MKTAYVVLKFGEYFEGATFDKIEAEEKARTIGNCQVVESRCEQDTDGKMKLLDIEMKMENQ